MQSFGHASRGLWALVKSQRQARFHAFATVAVVAAGFFFHLTSSEWCWIVLAVVAVGSSEALNTALEFLADATSPEFHPLVKKSKDIAAGAVLIAALGSAIIGLLVFGPHMLNLAKRFL